MMNVLINNVWEKYSQLIKNYINVHSRQTTNLSHINVRYKNVRTSVSSRRIKMKSG